ncbi:MAG TPA: tetratricopeptide repeat protein [Candidatus Polarisedimenticolia bacterium]|nr:tetratricopeptide repeat protein [Candidatus Polarisedimenticolia bacterium]
MPCASRIPIVIALHLGPRGSLPRLLAALLLLLLPALSCHKPDPRLAEADAALKSGDLTRALDLASEMLRESPQSAQALDRKGLALQGMGRPDAEQTFREAIRLEPSRPEAYDHLAALLYQSGKADDAIEQWRAAIRADGRYAPARYNLGSVLQARGNLEEAVAQFREAVDLAPEMVSARLNLGVALVSLGRFPGAEKELKEAVRLAPKDPEAAFNLGAAYVAARKTPEGIAELRRALSLRADFAEAHERLATAYYYEGKPSEAEREFKEALRLKQDFAEAHFGLGALYRERGDESQAIGEYEAALASQPRHAEAATNLALLYGRRAEPPPRAVNRIAAFEIYRRALLRGDYAAAWATLSQRTRRFYLDDPERFRYAAVRGFQDPAARGRLETATFFLRYLEPPVPTSAPGLPYDPARMDAIRETPEGDFKVDFRVLTGVPGPDPQR